MTDEDHQKLLTYIIRVTDDTATAFAGLHPAIPFSESLSLEYTIVFAYLMITAAIMNNNNATTLQLKSGHLLSKLKT